MAFLSVRGDLAAQQPAAKNAPLLLLSVPRRSIVRSKRPMLWSLPPSSLTSAFS